MNAPARKIHAVEIVDLVKALARMAEAEDAAKLTGRSSKHGNTIAAR